MIPKPLKGFALVPITELELSPENPRQTMTGIDELAQSIYEMGMIQPIIAQRIPGHDKLRIIAGHRRHAAALRIRMHDVPVIIRRDMLPDEELLAMLVENGQRANLDPIEEARALNRLKTAGVTQEEIARKIGRSVAYVSQRLLLLSLPAEEQEQLRAGATTLANAVDIAKVASGRVGKRTRKAERGWHFSHTHELSRLAKARCQRLHKGSRRVGGIACGECWESVIRADERQSLHQRSAQVGECALCGTPDTGVETRE